MPPPAVSIPHIRPRPPVPRPSGCWRGIISTGLLGAGFGFLYLWSGSLLLPMIVHALVDLRALGLLKGAFRAEPADELSTTSAT